MAVTFFGLIAFVLLDWRVQIAAGKPIYAPMFARMRRGMRFQSSDGDWQGPPDKVILVDRPLFVHINATACPAGRRCLAFIPARIRKAR